MATIHCQGSTSFMISVMLGLVPEVKTVISNAVSLHPIVPNYSLFKLWGYIPFVKSSFTYLNPQWGLHAPDFKSKALRMLVRATHWEKDTLVGKFVSFVYGAGFPALWRLENLNQQTLEWIQEEFAEVPLSFFLHIRKCIAQGKLVPLNADLQKEYVPSKPAGLPKIILFAGAKNKCFLPESQKKTYEYLEASDPGRHELYIFDNYSHLDIFFGKNAHEDVFALMINVLNNSIFQSNAASRKSILSGTLCHRCPHPLPDDRVREKVSCIEGGTFLQFGKSQCAAAEQRGPCTSPAPWPRCLVHHGDQLLRNQYRQVK